MKNSWKKDLLREYQSTALDNPYTVNSESKRQPRAFETVPICILLVLAICISAAAVSPLIFKWFSASVLTNQMSHLTKVPDGYVGIYTAEDLDSIRNQPWGNYILMNDLDLAGIDWVPIEATAEGPNPYTPFNGIFNGNGYVIRHLNIHADTLQSAGLFGQTNGTFLFLGLEDGEISLNIQTSADFQSEPYNIGTIAGSATFLGACYTENMKISVQVSDGLSPALSIGGLCGKVSYLDSCYVHADMEILVPNGTHTTVGKLAGQALSVVYSYSVGKVQASGSVQVFDLTEIAVGKVLPTVLKPEDIELLRQKFTERYGEDSYFFLRFASRYVLKDPSVEVTQEEKERITKFIQVINSLRNTTNSEAADVDPIYMLIPVIYSDEEQQIADVLLNLFGGQENLERFYFENGIRAGELGSYAFADGESITRDSLVGFDFDQLWVEQDDKVLLRIFCD